jgi:hypothetical protein
MPCRLHAASIPPPCRPTPLQYRPIPPPCRPMPRPCRSPAMPCRVNSHMPCRAPAILRQCRVLRESPRGSRKYSNCSSYSLTNWYASDNKLRGTPLGSRKKPNASRPPDADSGRTMLFTHAMPIPCRSHAVLCRGLEKSLSERHGHSIARARHGHGMTFVNQTRPRCVNHMGKAQPKPLNAGHDRGTEWCV